MNSPKVGIVQSTAMIRATIVAVRDVIRCLTRLTLGSSSPISWATSIEPRSFPIGRSTGATLLIGSPSACAGR